MTPFPGTTKVNLVVANYGWVKEDGGSGSPTEPLYNNLIGKIRAQYPLPRIVGLSWRECLTSKVTIHYPVGQYGVMDHLVCSLSNMLGGLPFVTGFLGRIITTNKQTLTFRVGIESSYATLSAAIRLPRMGGGPQSNTKGPISPADFHTRTHPCNIVHTRAGLVCQ